MTTFDPRSSHGYDVGIRETLRIARGENLLLRENLKAHGLKNGDIATVEQFETDGTIQLADGRSIPSTYGGLTHGYAVTSHAAQGKTVDRGILLLSEQGLMASHLQQAYVSNSRFRETQTLFVTSRLQARERMQKEEVRNLALEHFKPVGIRSQGNRIKAG